MGRLGTAQMFARTLLGMLLRVKPKCVYFIFFNVRFLVGFGAVMMGGAFVMHCRGTASQASFVPRVSHPLFLGADCVRAWEPLGIVGR
jgi:hypothetical protein